MAEESNKEQEYDLRKSKDDIGYLFPVIEDAFGNVVDGNNRLEADPNWPRERRMNLDTPLKSAKARLDANAARRTVNPQEITDALVVIAELTKKSPREIAEEVKRSYSWVMKYLPDRYKRSGGYNERITRSVIRGPMDVMDAIALEVPSSTSKAVASIKCPLCNHRTLLEAKVPIIFQRFLSKVTPHGSLTQFLNENYGRYLRQPLKPQPLQTELQSSTGQDANPRQED